MATVFCSAAGSAPAPLTVASPHDTVRIAAADREVRALMSRSLQRRVDSSAHATVAATLDSLGFLSPRWDTASAHTLRVDPGPRSLIDTITIDPAGIVSMDSVARLRYPVPFDAGFLNALAERTVAAYAGRGFPFARLSMTVSQESRSPGPARLRVRFSLDPDVRCLFGDPAIGGYARTRPAVLRHDLRMPPGAIFDVRKVTETRDRLLSRPYIASATAGQPRISVPATGQHADSAPRAVVPITVGERSGLGIDGVVGFRSDADDRARFSGDLTVSLLNTIGWGEQADLAYRADDRQQRLDAAGLLPWVFNTPLEVRIAGGLEVREDDYGYLHGMAQVRTELRPRIQGGVGIKGFRNETASAHRTCAGGDILVQRIPESPGRGLWSRELETVVGSGLLSTAGRRTTRWNIDFTAGIHVPLLDRWAAHVRLVTNNLISPEDSIPAVELYRVGGYRSVRGYPDQAFPLRSVAYGQSELLLYFARTGAVYFLCDGGIGFRDRFTASNRDDLLGYGIGGRFGTRIGAFSMEWARNIRDTRSLGRIHIRFQSPLSLGSRP